MGFTLPIIKLELNIPDDRVFLNFWNGYNGDDVVCQIIDGKLMLIQYDGDENELPLREIELPEFIEMVKTRIEEVIE
jgi:hypothetical protein